MSQTPPPKRHERIDEPRTDKRRRTASVAEQLVAAAAALRDAADGLGEQLVADNPDEQQLVVYNPLQYAWGVHEAYLRRAAGHGARTILLGMNPGPHGMGQMGVPFATPRTVRELLGISGIAVSQPARSHPKRPVLGLAYNKEEVSGTRLWGLLEAQYGDADRIFERLVVINFCPLIFFIGERGANRTPDKVGPSRAPHSEACVCSPSTTRARAGEEGPRADRAARSLRGAPGRVRGRHASRARHRRGPLCRDVGQEGARRAPGHARGIVLAPVLGVAARKPERRQGLASERAGGAARGRTCRRWWQQQLRAARGLNAFCSTQSLA